MIDLFKILKFAKDQWLGVIVSILWIIYILFMQIADEKLIEEAKVLEKVIIKEKLRVETLYKTNTVIDNKIKYSYPIKQSIVQIKKLPPGEYSLRVLADNNDNGYWDTGKFGRTPLQPEIVKQLTEVLSLRANWENELNIIINK